MHVLGPVLGTAWPMDAGFVIPTTKLLVSLPRPVFTKVTSSRKASVMPSEAHVLAPLLTAMRRVLSRLLLTICNCSS